MPAFSAVAAIAIVFLLRSSPAPQPMSTVVPASDTAAATWAAGKKRAPAFTLLSEQGKPLSLASFRGRPVLITFIDPLCRDYCPIEAQHLSDVARAQPAGQKPEIVAVSVNTLGDTRATLALDRRKWSTTPQWHWAIGREAALAQVWHHYDIAVVATTRTIAGVKVRNVVHTEASYLIDRDGYERALFLWPYTAKAVTDALRSLPATTS